MRFIEPQNIKPAVKSIIVNTLENIAPTVNIEPLQTEFDSADAYDLMDLMDDIYDFLNQYQKRTNEFKNLSFIPSFTYYLPSESDQDSLRYKIVQRTDGTMEQGAAPHSGRRNFKWTLYNVMEDAKNPGYKVLFYAKPMDNTVDLVCWSKNYRDANRSALDLENIFDMYGYLFKKKGLNALRFEGRQSDAFHEKSNVAWYGCPLRYYFRTMKIKMVYEKTLEEIVLELITQ